MLSCHLREPEEGNKMEWSLLFFLNSVLFGVGLAMDAFSVSMANGLHEPDMKKSRMCLVAGTFALFQIMMPLIGWACIHTIAELFTGFQRFIPWIALILLLYLGGKMFLEGWRSRNGNSEENVALGWTGLLLQGVATSIDALSVGFTIAEYPMTMALTEALIIGVVTFVICLGGLRIGKLFGTKLAGKASILGGVILIGIGLEIFLTGVF